MEVGRSRRIWKAAPNLRPAPRGPALPGAAAAGSCHVFLLHEGSHDVHGRLLLNLCAALNKLGKHEEALQTAEQRLELSGGTYGPEHPMTATCLNDVGTFAQAFGQYDRAEELFEAGERDGPTLERALTSILTEGLGRAPDYAVVVSPDDLSRRATVTTGDVALLAGRVGGRASVRGRGGGCHAGDGYFGGAGT
mgnify:CR=1 FL=1